MATRDYTREKNDLREAIARFPKHFGLRAYPEKLFRIGVRESFVDDNGNPKLYTQVLAHTQELPKLEQRGCNPHGYSWLDFAKGTEEELTRQLTSVPERWLEYVRQDNENEL